jgi:hypothetical protein
MEQQKTPSGNHQVIPARPNVQRKTPNNNNVAKDTNEIILFSSIFERFCDLEISFMIHHMNKENTFGIKMDRQSIQFMEINAIREFIDNVNVGSIGQSVVACILSKLSNNQNQ